jgi:hypothetical protein
MMVVLVTAPPSIAVQMPRVISTDSPKSSAWTINREKAVAAGVYLAVAGFAANEFFRIQFPYYGRRTGLALRTEVASTLCPII